MRILFLFALLSCVNLSADWAEERLKEMSLDEKIGQLFIVPACPLRLQDHLIDLASVFEKYHVGGVILKQGDAAGQVRMIRWLKTLSKDPILCVGDAEWGLGMRLTDTLSFPKNLTLGAIQNSELLYELGKEMGVQCKKVGLHINLAPVVDVNCNPNNLIIHMRSFGEDPEEVAKRATLVLKGMQEKGVAGCAKHFIGHGDTQVDSHVDLPVISHPKERLERLELLPFQKMVDANVACVMTGHLSVPHLDKTKPVTFSAPIVKGLLQEKMGYQGLIMTDALNMQGIVKGHSYETIAREALLAGHDLLLYGDHIAPGVDEILRVQIPAAFGAIKKAVQEKIIADEEFDQHILRILRFKQTLPKEPLSSEDVTSTEAKELKRRLFREAVTLLKNSNQIIPLSPSSTLLLVEIEESLRFAQHLARHRQVKVVKLDELADLKDKPVCVLAVSKITNQVVQATQTLSANQIPTIILLFGSPYTLESEALSTALVVAYEKDPDAMEAAADLLFGKLTPKGKLPVSVPDFPRGSGMEL